MAAVLRSIFGLAAVGAAAACYAYPQADPAEPVNQSCRALCCSEFESPCTTKATFACEGCDERCRGARGDAGPLVQCMRDAGAKFECSPKGVIRPVGEVCAAEFNSYQQIDDPRARVGGGR